MVATPLQLSVAVQLPTVVGTALHCTVRLAGTNVNTGAKVSRTVMVWVHVEALPYRSSARYARVILKRLAHSKLEILKPRLVLVTELQLSKVTTKFVSVGAWTADDLAA